jgi:hypothetical protein
MEIEMEATSEPLIERLELAAAALEQAAERLATVELEAAATRESALAERLAEAESTIATLRAQAAAQSTRKTAPAGVLTSKEGLALEAGALDTALSSLSVEQRIAVKAQLLRSGFLG